MYLAGQAEVLESDDRPEYVLLPADTDPADLRRRAIRSGDLAQWMLVDTQVRRLSSHPGASQLSDEFAEAPRLEAGEDTLGQGRAAQVMRHNITQAARPASCHDSAAIVIAHHVVSAYAVIRLILSAELIEAFSSIRMSVSLLHGLAKTFPVSSRGSSPPRWGSPPTCSTNCGGSTMPRPYGS
jgi:hypothetical protein